MEGKLLAQDTALVTGAASGIGRGIAIAIAREGARVLLCDQDEQRGEDAAASLRREACDARFVAADLAAQEGPAMLLAGDLGAPSIFVHAASPPRREADNILSVSESTWDRMLSVNLRAGFILARGSEEQIAALRLDDEFLRLNARAGLIVERFGVVDAAVDDGVAEQVSVYQEAIADLA